MSNSSKQAEELEKMIRAWHRDMDALMLKVAELPQDVRMQGYQHRLASLDRLISFQMGFIDNPGSDNPLFNIVRNWDLIALRKRRIEMAALLGVVNN